MIKKVAALWLSLAMVFSFIIIIVQIASVVRAPSIIYVDDVPGEGPGNPAENFTSIQDAINASIDGDTVFVYNGTYYENIIVNKSISLIGESRVMTIINGSGLGDVVHIISDWVNITGFTVIESGSSSWDAGLELNNVRKCKITDNNISSNNEIGVYLSSSSHNIITSNNISSNEGSGIHIYASSSNNITNNKISNNFYGVFLFISSNNKITNNNVLDNNDGVRLELSSNNEITVNNISSNTEYSVYLDSSSNNTITSNNASNNFNGIYLVDLSSSNNIIDNYVTLNAWVGIIIASSSNNNIISNKILSNFNYGISVYSSKNNNITDNIVSSNINYGIYLDSSSKNNLRDNIISSNNIGGLYLWDSSNNNITINNLSNNRYGIGLSLSSNNNITYNHVSPTNWDGISLIGSSNNYIISNNISSNINHGIYLESSSNNVIYHNNFINNINQAYDDMNDNLWNDTYPSGGNYWSDYSGIDNFKGPNQDIPGSDGIGDTNYSIDSDSLDNYPLMEPYTYKPLENYSVLKQGWNLISVPLIQKEQNLIKVLEMIDGYYDAVQWFDNSDINNQWKHCKVGKPFGNDLNKINETMGFWILITQPGDTIFLYNGTQPIFNQTIPLHPGWNLVGYPSLTSYNRTEGLNNLTFGLHVDSIWTFNAATQKWKEIGQTDYFEIGRGYWIHTKTKCEWEVPI